MSRRTDSWVDKLPVERISQATFNSLLEYSCSLPTGTTVGKVWKRNLHAYTRPRRDPLWVICEYVEHEDPKRIGIEYRKPEVTD